MTSDVTDVVRALRERLAALDDRPLRGRRAGRSPRGSLGPRPATPGAIDQRARPRRAGCRPDRGGAGRGDRRPRTSVCGCSPTRPGRGPTSRQKLRRRGISAPVIERVLDRFTEVGLIDDQAYAEAYVRTKHQERALSRRALTAELRRKGVDDDRGRCRRRTGRPRRRGDRRRPDWSPSGRRRRWPPARRPPDGGCWLCSTGVDTRPSCPSGWSRTFSVAGTNDCRTAAVRRCADVATRSGCRAGSALRASP